MLHNAAIFSFVAFMLAPRHGSKQANCFDKLENFLSFDMELNLNGWSTKSVNPSERTV
jgi:hypothetical protein